MSPQEALTIIQTLADGIDPQTGEVLSDQSPFNQPPVIRALHAATLALSRTIELPSDSQQAPSPKKADNAGRSWSPEEDLQLKADYESGVDPKALAQRHGRTTGAIKSRLVKLGLLVR